MFHTVPKQFRNERNICAELRINLNNICSKRLKHQISVTVEQVPTVGRYAPHRHVLTLSPQETAPKEVGPFRFRGRHILDLRMQLGDRQQGKHVLLLFFVCFVVKKKTAILITL
jgi:hypothetical protein